MLFALTLLLSAALVFLIQPMLAKQLLPLLGGGAAVWTACMLFFQTMLLAGYSYAHLLGRCCSPLRQRNIHSVLLLLSAIWLAFLLPERDSLNSEQPLITLLIFLLQSIGLPYLLLSATGPLLQHWFAGLQHNKSPYVLYAVSNVGSLVGLLCYPFIVEPLLPLAAQWQLWLGCYAVFTLSILLLMWRLLPGLLPTYRAGALKLRQAGALQWLALSACGVILLLSVTQQITQNIAPVPFLWVLPLGLYLLSYILAFKWPGGSQRQIWLYVFCLNLIIGLALFYFGRQFDVLSQLIFYLLILFSGCMLCHLGLARTAPQSSHLTAFYFWLALGGALGSLLMNLLLPLLFVRQYEFLLVMLAIALLSLRPELKQKPVYQLVTAAALLLFGSMVWLAERAPGTADVFSGRNFYGSVQVRDIRLNNMLQRQLIDGTTSHGSQYLAPPLSAQAQSYYRTGSGGALALEYFLAEDASRSAAQIQQRQLGLIGLGAGALAVYAKPGDKMTFYEINPLVITAATEYFSYLSDSAAEVEIVPGDGRLQLQHQLQSGSRQFDVLVLDAFSSDSVPQHLLTKEAMQLYWQHLLSDGVLAVHVSNNYLDLSALLRNHAVWLDKQAYFFSLPAQQYQPATQWILLTSNQRFTTQRDIQQAIIPWAQAAQPGLMWTDDFSNLLQILK